MGQILRNKEISTTFILIKTLIYEETNSYYFSYPIFPKLWNP